MQSRTEIRIFPKNFFEQIEFDQIRQLTASYAYSDGVKKALLQLHPVGDANIIHKELREVDAYKRSKEDGHVLPLSNYSDVGKAYDRLRIEGYVLEIEQIVELGNHMLLCDELNKWKRNNRSKDFTALLEILKDLPDLKEELNAYQKVFDLNAEIRADASPKLVKISNEIEVFERKMNQSFDRLVKIHRDAGILDVSQESFRNGRRVLSVLAEHKRQIKGIIHGESGGGRIYYIEPESMVHLNNELYDLKNERRKEIHRILLGLCSLLRLRIEDLLEVYKILTQLDFIRSKGELAILLDAERPEVMQSTKIKLYKVRHPLLTLKNRQTGKAVIPFDLHLHTPNQMLLISGPNAGGKSVTLKAFALAQIMVQSGLLPTCSAQSEFGIFQSFYSDIGDQQSIDASLSTYSSRLTTLKHILHEANSASLVLIDEFGSGTDPQLGAALAESVLRKFIHLGVWGVITTHYSNLKMYAYKTKGLVNGGMLFDDRTLAPTYQLKIGKPGNSYAFEVAQKIGLSNDVLSYAKKRSSQDLLTLEKMISSLERQEKRSEELNVKLRRKQKELDALIKSYETLKADLDVKKKKFKIQQKEERFNYEEKLKREVAKLAKNLKQGAPQKALRRKQKEIADKQKELVRETKEIENRISDIQQDDGFLEGLKEGQYVKLKKNDLSGRVVSIDKSKVLIEVGNMTMHVDIRDLSPSGEPLDIKKKKSIHEFVSDKGRIFVPKLDIRGFPLKEAQHTLQKFMDEAILSDAYRLEIIHGKGTGALRKMVHNALKDFTSIKSISHPQADRGGEGITIVEF